MHPAKSVIFFTTASGAGYGLAIWLTVMAFLGLLPQTQGFAFVSMAVALGLILSGLLSSTFHLGHPERAWRALSQWRSSWLSREGVLAILTFIPLSLFAIGWIFLGTNSGLFAIIGLLGAAMSLLTVYTTSMIYACLKTIPAWHNKWTIMGYLTFSLMSGAILANLICRMFGQIKAADFLLVPAFILILLGLFVKIFYWSHIHNSAPVSTAETATGLSQFGKVSFAGSPHTQDNYLLKEMGFKIARKHADKLRHYAIFFAFLMPLALLGGLGFWAKPALEVPLSIIAAFSTMIGLALERWLFFAEAKHVVTLYYGESQI